MAWDKGRYYTRSVKRKGRVFREYYGTGIKGEVMAHLDEERRSQRKAIQEEKRVLQAVEDIMRELDDACDLLARAALFAAGYHQHHRGEWRKKRQRMAMAIQCEEGDDE